MRCSNCYKKIPQGEEIDKSVVLPWRSWGIFCKKCAKKLDKQSQIFLIVFFCWFLFCVVASVIFIFLKGNKN